MSEKKLSLSKRVTSFIVVFLTLLLLKPAIVAAQNLSLGVAQGFHIEDSNVPDASIISVRNSEYRVSAEPYEKGMMGVVSINSALILEYDDNPGTVAVITEGIALVRVNEENGPIKQGDMLTSSSIPGEAMKATKSGFILGIAQEDYPSSEDTNPIAVALDIKFAFAADSPPSEQIGTRLLNVLSLSNIALVEQPTMVLRYVLAALVIIGTFLFTFLLFARSVANGIEALGRNPVATSSILLGMILNVLISIGILGTGLSTAYFITVL